MLAILAIVRIYSHSFCTTGGYPGGTSVMRIRTSELDRQLTVASSGMVSVGYRHAIRTKNYFEVLPRAKLQCKEKIVLTTSQPDYLHNVLSTCRTPFVFHSRLKTHLFHKFISSSLPGSFWTAFTDLEPVPH